MTSAGHPATADALSSAEERSAPGARGSCGAAEPDESSSSKRGLSAKARVPGRPGGPRPRRHARRRSGLACSAGFYRDQRDVLGIDSGFVAQGYLLPCFTEAEVAAAQTGSPCSRLGLDVRWLARRVRRDEPRACARHDAGRHLLRRRRLHRPRRATSRLRRALAPAASRSSSRSGSTVWRRTGARSQECRRSRGAISTPRVVLTGGPSWPRWARRPVPRSSRAARGTRSSSPRITQTLRPARLPWSSICVRPLLAARRGRDDVGDEQSR